MKYGLTIAFYRVEDFEPTLKLELLSTYFARMEYRFQISLVRVMKDMEQMDHIDEQALLWDEHHLSRVNVELVSGECHW